MMWMKYENDSFQEGVTIIPCGAGDEISLAQAILTLPWLIVGQQR